MEAHCHHIVCAVFERAGRHEEDGAGLDEAVDLCGWVVLELGGHAERRKRGEGKGAHAVVQS